MQSTIFAIGGEFFQPERRASRKRGAEAVPRARQAGFAGFFSSFLLSLFSLLFLLSAFVSLPLSWSPQSGTTEAKEGAATETPAATRARRTKRRVVMRRSFGPALPRVNPGALGVPEECP